MAAYKGPKIITDGLVMQLDAADIRSYPGTGTLWSDVAIANNFINATLIASPTYNTGNKGYFTFNGTTQYANVGSSPVINALTTSVTVSSWVNIAAYPTSGRPSIYTTGAGVGGLSQQTYLRLNFTGASLEIGTTNTVGTDHKTTYAYSNLTLNTWYNIVGKYTGAAWQLYVNGILANSTVDFTGPQNVGYTTILVGAELNSGLYRQFLNGSVASVYVYNTALSNEQILQNFVALRGRYLV